VAEAEINPPAWMLPVWFSAATTSYEDGELTAVSLCTRTRQLGLQPVTILDGSITSVIAHPPLSDSRLPLLQRAYDADRMRTRNAPIYVHDQNAAKLAEGSLDDPRAWEILERQQDERDRRPTGRLRRTAPYAGVLRVR
jgi:hypothetical protein